MKNLIALVFALFSKETHSQRSKPLFVHTGALQIYTVPAGVTTLTVTAAGAQGGRAGQGESADTDEPGKGGLIVGVVSVTPGSTLHVFVGGSGRSLLYDNEGGFNGGGSASYFNMNTSNSWGGGGGGSSDIRTIPDVLASRLFVAGGGGGQSVDDALCF